MEQNLLATYCCKTIDFTTKTSFNVWASCSNWF